MKNKVLILATFLSIVASCNKESTVENNPRNIISLTTKGTELVKSNNSFAIKLMQLHSDDNISYIFSPFSIQLTLAMVCEAAAGETRDEILSMLNISSNDIVELENYCKLMSLSLTNADKKVDFSIANAAFILKGLLSDELFSSRFNTNFVDILSENYMAYVNMFSDRENLIVEAKRWAEANTEGLLGDYTVEASEITKLFLMNAFSFSGQWQNKFKKEDTKEEDFVLLNGNTIKIPMMKRRGAILCTTKYGQDNSPIYTAISLPYGNGAYHFQIFLPAEGHKLSDVLEQLSDTGLPKFIEEQISIWIPRFSVMRSFNISDDLKNLGIATAFDLQANFSNFITIPMRLESVYQNAYFKVDESGSKAAVVTSGSIGGDTAPQPHEFHADHPFVWFVTETSTNTMVLGGQYCGV